MEQIYLILTGSILALTTSFLVEFYKDWSKNRSILKNFKIVLKLELKNLILIVDKLSDSYAAKNFFAVRVIDQLDRNLQRFESIRRDSIFLKEDNRKEEILNYFNDIYVLSSDLRSNENYGFNVTGVVETEEVKKTREDFTSKERQIISLRMVDLKRRGQDIINYLEA